MSPIAHGHGRTWRVATRGALALVAAVLVYSPSTASAGECRELGGIGVAVGGLVGLGVVTVTSLVGPAIAVAADDSLPYGVGVGVSSLSGLTAGGAGMLVSAMAVCEAGLWLPGVAAGGSSVVATVIWGVVASEGSSQSSVRSTTAIRELHLPMVTLAF